MGTQLLTNQHRLSIQTNTHADTCDIWIARGEAVVGSHTVSRIWEATEASQIARRQQYKPLLARYVR